MEAARGARSIRLILLVATIGWVVSATLLMQGVAPRMGAVVIALIPSVAISLFVWLRPCSVSLVLRLIALVVAAGFMISTTSNIRGGACEQVADGFCHSQLFYSTVADVAVFWIGMGTWSAFRRKRAPSPPNLPPPPKPWHVDPTPEKPEP